MIFIPNYHWNHTKIGFGMIPVAIWYEYHTSVFAVIAIAIYIAVSTHMLVDIFSYLASMKHRQEY